MIPQLVAESISKFKPAKSMHVRSVGHSGKPIEKIVPVLGIVFAGNWRYYMGFHPAILHQLELSGYPLYPIR